MATNRYPANILLGSVFFFLLFLIPFAVIRLYFYFNYFIPVNEIVVSDIFWLAVTGARFDLCVIGFLLIPSYVLYLFSYWDKSKSFSYAVNQIYKAVVLILVVYVFHLNIPFMIVNSTFNFPYWMRWEDYQSIFGVDCAFCYNDFGYLSKIYPIQVISGLMFTLIFFASFADWKYFSKTFNWRREILFIVLITLLARGKLGHHHLRFEDSLWHRALMVNELSNNPLWLIDKHKN